jgi:RNA polymerase sigma-70 factor (ECF subfamily)
MARIIPINAAEEVVIKAEAPITTSIEATQLEAQYMEALLAMPEARRNIFTLSRFEGKSYREIADYLNISVKTVEAQMGKALGYLRIELADYLVSILVLVAHNLFTFLSQPFTL